VPMILTLADDDATLSSRSIRIYEQLFRYTIGDVSSVSSSACPGLNIMIVVVQVVYGLGACVSTKAERAAS